VIRALQRAGLWLERQKATRHLQPQGGASLLQPLGRWANAPLANNYKSSGCKFDSTRLSILAGPPAEHVMSDDLTPKAAEGTAAAHFLVLFLMVLSTFITVGLVVFCIRLFYALEGLLGTLH
jgi:hypothetical protein